MDIGSMLSQSRSLAEEFIKFLNYAYTPFHVVDYCRKELEKQGFMNLKENTNWSNLEKGGKYFVTRNNSAIMAFTIGKSLDLNDTGFKIIGTHTDSPGLYLAPLSKLNGKDFNTCCVQTYGGGIWSSWIDRDLKIGGKIIYKNKENSSLASTLFQVNKPIMKISGLAIHLVSQEERAGIKINTEQHLRPLISTEVYNALLSGKPEKSEKEDKDDEKNTVKHNEKLMQLIEKETKINREDIIDTELILSDYQEAQLCGINDEFISSQKMDNLFSTFLALKTIQLQQNENQKYVNLIVMFDHEEIGSNSPWGAKSSFILKIMERIFDNLAKTQKDVKVDSFDKARANSFCISCDVAHAIHPNFSDKHQMNHKININKGIVVKVNVNQSYATNAVTKAVVDIIAKKYNVAIQEFIVKQDLGCGSTIGPTTASVTGIKTIDIGAPQLGMHSIRETMGILDLYYNYQLFKGFFEEYENIKLDLFSY